jgi:hypothetical protein
MINCSRRQDGLQLRVPTDLGQRVGRVPVSAKERELRNFHAIVCFSHYYQVDHQPHLRRF